MYWKISVNSQFIWPHLNFSYNEPSVVIRFPSFYLCESLTHTVFQQHLNMHICLSNKNEDSLFIFSTDVQNKLPYLGTLFTLSDLLLQCPDFALCLHTGLQMRGVREIIVVLLLWQTPVPYQCACPFPLKRESLLCFLSDVEMAVRCCCFSTAFHIATATWLVLWSQNSLRDHIDLCQHCQCLASQTWECLRHPGVYMMRL